MASPVGGWAAPEGAGPEADATALTVSTWALFHGLALLRRQVIDALPGRPVSARLGGGGG